MNYGTKGRRMDGQIAQQGRLNLIEQLPKQFHANESIGHHG